SDVNPRRAPGPKRTHQLLTPLFLTVRLPHGTSSASWCLAREAAFRRDRWTLLPGKCPANPVRKVPARRGCSESEITAGRGGSPRSGAAPSCAGVQVGNHAVQRVRGVPGGGGVPVVVLGAVGMIRHSANHHPPRDGAVGGRGVVAELTQPAGLH